jgi:hypothetical protein
MSEEKYLGMRPGDLDGKPYAKYWNPEMAPMQDHVQRALMHGVEASALGFPVGEANQLLEPGYLPLENGFTRLQNGQVYVSVLTKMPRVTGEMIDWWFGWHYLETQRYKLWHPRAHVANRAERMLSDDPNVSDREKYLRNPNYVTEYVGCDLIDIDITFSEPAEFFDVARFQQANVSTAVCGIVGYQNSPISFGVLIHLIRETEDGCEMRSRFWLGNIETRGLPGKAVLDKIVGAPFVAKHAASLDLGRDMVAHCAMEMNHLAGFLPDLYADYHASA